MVIRVLESRLERVVVDICNGAFGFNTVYIHSQKLNVRHSSRCVLRQSLVYFQSYLTAFFEFSVDCVRLQYFLGKGKSHFVLPVCGKFMHRMNV